MTKTTISKDELMELVDYLVTPRIRDERYRELLAKYDEVSANEKA